MLSFFRINTVYKTLILFFFFVLLRLPAFIYGLPLTNYELNWMILAEKMNTGAVLYKDIWDNTAPLSAFIYFMIHFFFYNDRLIYQIVASILVFFQALMINRIFVKRQIFSEITLYPAFFYIILSHLFIDSFTLTPTLMSNTFLILSWQYMLLHIGERKRYNAVFEIGALIGIASLFHLPSALFLLVPFLSFLLMTDTKLNDYLLMFFSFVFTVGIILIIFYIFNNEYYFYYNYLRPLLYFNPKIYISFLNLGIILGFTILLSILAILKANNHKFNNFQARAKQIANASFVISFISAFFDTTLSLYHFFLILPAVSYLFTYYFLYLTRVLIKELVFSIFLLSVLTITYVSFFPFLPIVKQNVKAWINVSEMLVSEYPEQELLKNKRILVLGDKIDYYKGAKLASPYLSWRLTTRLFNEIPNDYKSKVAFYETLKKNLPEIIVNVDNNIKVLFKHLALLKEVYKPIPNTNFYKLDPKKKAILE